MILVCMPEPNPEPENGANIGLSRFKARVAAARAAQHEDAAELFADLAPDAHRAVTEAEATVEARRAALAKHEADLESARQALAAEKYPSAKRLRELRDPYEAAERCVEDAKADLRSAQSAVTTAVRARNTAVNVELGRRDPLRAVARDVAEDLNSILEEIVRALRERLRSAAADEELAGRLNAVGCPVRVRPLETSLGYLVRATDPAPVLALNEALIRSARDAEDRARAEAAARAAAAIEAQRQAAEAARRVERGENEVGDARAQMLARRDYLGVSVGHIAPVVR